VQLDENSAAKLLVWVLVWIPGGATTAISPKVLAAMPPFQNDA